MRIENPPELSQYAGDLTQAFPDVLGLLVALIRLKRSLKSSLLIQSFSDFFNGFGRTMVRVASLRLKLDN